MKNKLKLIIIFIFLIFCFVIFYKGLNNSNTYIPKANDEKNIPVFKAKQFNSNNYINSEKVFEENSYYIVNIWASWCAPCRIEHPVLIQLSKEKNLKLVGVNFKDKKKQADKFLNDFGDPYDFLTKDEQGKYSVNLGVYGIPESILINKDLTILKKFVGPLSAEDFNSIIAIIN